jgi:hypothetical protein
VNKQQWLILIYRLPREPSRPRVAAWRKLKALGALYLQDGVVALPDDAVTREQLEWLQLQIREANRTLIAGAERVQRKAELGGSKALPEELSKLEREFRMERRRDYFRSPLRKEAASALRAARQAVRQGNDADGIGVGSGG